MGDVRAYLVRSDDLPWPPEDESFSFTYVAPPPPGGELSNLHTNFTYDRAEWTERADTPIVVTAKEGSR